MPDPDTRKRAPHLGPQRRRPQVLDAALQIAAEEGIGQVTMGTIAAKLGVTRPVVYDCFHGRADLLAALLQREQDLALAGVLATLPPPRTGSVEQMFVDGFRLFLDVVHDRPASWRIIVGLDADPMLTQAITHSRARIAGQVQAVMRPLFDRWNVADVDRVSPVLVEVFLAIGESAVRMLLDPAQSWSPAALAEVIGPCAHRALRAK